MVFTIFCITIKNMFLRYFYIKSKATIMTKFTILFITLLTLVAAPAKADLGDWRIYAAYHNATEVAAMHNRVYVLSDGSLYSYDPEDTSVETYDKASHLSDFQIYGLLPCKATNELVIVYVNGNIDLMDADGNVFNMPELKLKSLDDKTINHITVCDGILYISTNTGLVCVDLTKRAFGNFYNIGQAIKKVNIVNGDIYASTANGTYRGLHSENLLDPSNWTVVPSSQLPDFSSSTQVETTRQVEMGGTVWKACGSEGLKGFASTAEDAEVKVESIIPNSPQYNYFYQLYLIGNERLLAAGGNFSYPEVKHKLTAMKWEDNSWLTFDIEDARKEIADDLLLNATDIAQDPEDPDHHFVGTARSGVYEFQDYKYVRHITYTNSPLKSILPDIPSAGAYVRVTGLNYDSAGNLWMCNNQVDTIIRIMNKDNSWSAVHVPEIDGYPTFDHIVFDHNNWAWINSRRSTSSHYAGFLVIDTSAGITNTKAFRSKFIGPFQNQDGTSYTPTELSCLTEDLDGVMWIGCNFGVFAVYDSSQLFSSDFTITQIKVARNDGTNLADYLLSEVPVKCITIDGGNRKWIGTAGFGVFLVTADGQETIAHYTCDNSPLISDIINDIKINGSTGEVFIATDAGLVSIQGDATDPVSSFNKDLVTVYPNPVRPDYVGNISITGMMYNSHVKIVNAAGYLVNEGTSTGGTYTWNGRTANGKRCSSGIYYVLATDAEGNKGVVSKFLIVKE